jgi:hypothetical protein
VHGPAALEGPGAIARYFQTKRRLIAEDLFGWFRSLAFDVDAERTELDGG